MLVQRVHDSSCESVHICCMIIFTDTSSITDTRYSVFNADMDFNSSIHIINIPFGYSSSTEIDIKLIQDGVSELEEVFLITLKVAEDTPVSMKEEVTLGSRDFTVAHILQSCMYKPVTIITAKVTHEATKLNS